MPAGIKNRTQGTKTKLVPGLFPHRKDDDACTHYGGTCHVNRQQRDPAEDVCNGFCIPQRTTHGDKCKIEKEHSFAKAEDFEKSGTHFGTDIEELIIER